MRLHNLYCFRDALEKSSQLVYQYNSISLSTLWLSEERVCLFGKLCKKTASVFKVKVDDALYPAGIPAVICYEAMIDFYHLNALSHQNRVASHHVHNACLELEFDSTSD